MKRLILLGEVAKLSLILEKSRRPTVHHFESIEKNYFEPLGSTTTSNGGITDSFSTAGKIKHEFEASSLKQMISDILDEWDEPELMNQKDKEVTITDVLHFRRALDFIDNENPFSVSFGRASSRAECVESSQIVFDRLTKGSGTGILEFDVLCQIAQLPDGFIDHDKVRTLVKVFCPNRQGTLSKLDFVRSIDR